MTGLVETARDKLNDSCFVDKCSKHGCCVSLKGAPGSRVIVDFDAKNSPLGRASVRPDYLFVADREDGVGWIALMELTSGEKTAMKAVGQIRAGANMLNRRRVFSRLNFTFRPILAAKDMRKAERDALREDRHRIALRPHKGEPVRFIECGDPLSDVFPS